MNRYLVVSSHDGAPCGIVAVAANRADAFRIAREIAAKDNVPVFVDDRMARYEQPDRWRVAPHDERIVVVNLKRRHVVCREVSS